MIKRILVIFFEASPLISIPLSCPHKDKYKIIDEYCRKYGFDRKRLSGCVLEVLDDPELTEIS